MSSFFGGQTSSTNSGATNQPAWAGVYTTDQSKSQTGGTQTPTATAGGAAPQGGAQPSAAPASGGAAGAQPQQQGASAQQQARSAGPVDFSQFLAANQQGAANTSSAVTGSAASAATGLGSAATAFDSAAQTAAKGAPQATAFTGSTVADINAASTGPYTGPTASSLSQTSAYQAYQAQQAQAQKAQQALQNQAPSNGFDAAVAHATQMRQQQLNAQGQLQQAGTQAQQAVQAGQGAATGAAQAYNTTVAQNKAALGTLAQQGADAAASAKAGTASTVSNITGALGTVSSGAQLEDTLKQYAPQLAQLGFSPQDIQQLEQEVGGDRLSYKDTVNWLNQQINNAAGQATGYTASQAAIENAANTKLGNTGSTAAASSYKDDASKLSNQAAQNEDAIKQLQQYSGANFDKTVNPGASAGQTAARVGEDAANTLLPGAGEVINGLSEHTNFAPMDNTVGYLMANGLSPSDITTDMGFSSNSPEYKEFVDHYSKYSTNVQNVYGSDEGAAYNPNSGASQLKGKV